MSQLFESYQVGKLKLRNRIAMSPMCQYKAHGDGLMNDWHFVHYVSRAVGGTGLILTEMTNVEARGRITEGCLGLWNEHQAAAGARLVDRVHEFGASIGVQLAHAGRKSTIPGNDVVAPSSVPFDPDGDGPLPRELSIGEIEDIVEAFGRSAELAIRAGYDTIELHGAHGYLLHEFMSPSSNKRNDEYADLAKFAVDVVSEVRRQVGKDYPLIFRVSATETNQDGYDFATAMSIMEKVVAAGIDAVDVSTGGNGPIRPPAHPGYQLDFAREVKQLFGLTTASVGRLENPEVAEYAVASGSADIVMIGRGLLRNPYWARDAADALSAGLKLPGVYERGIK